MTYLNSLSSHVFAESNITIINYFQTVVCKSWIYCFV